MPIQQFTVMFELDDSPAVVDPQTFETAIYMTVRHRDLASADWLNFRIRRMVLTEVRTLKK